jgi:hypothetical protein
MVFLHKMWRHWNFHVTFSNVYKCTVFVAYGINKKTMLTVYTVNLKWKATFLSILDMYIRKLL